MRKVTVAGPSQTYILNIPCKSAWGKYSYLLHRFQALVHLQSISQCNGSPRSNFIPSKTVEESTPELVQAVKKIKGTVSLTQLA